MTSFVGNYLLNLVPLAMGCQPARPLLFSYYVTHRCRMRCRYCSDGEGKPFSDDTPTELSTADAKRLITILSRSADTLDVTGGEPMLRADLEELLAHARSAGMHTALNTKGVGLRERPEILGLCDVIVLGIDTMDEGRLAMMLGTGQAAAQEILKSLHFAVARSDAARVVISSVAMPDNLQDVADVLRFAMGRRWATASSARSNTLLESASARCLWAVP